MYFVGPFIDKTCILEREKLGEADMISLFTSK